jgi:PLP dependent protein
MSIKANLASIKSQLKPFSARLIAVTKTHPVSVLEEAYMAGCKVFGENKVQEMVEKYEQLPKDIKWHLIGHLQTNKVKFIAPFVSLIHSIDSLKLLEEVNKQAQKNNRVIDCLLQIYIAQEDTKFGFSAAEAEALIGSNIFAMLKNVRIMGLMGMASNTDDNAQIQQEFRRLKQLFDKLKQQTDLPTNVSLTELSMGMSSDYPIALAEGSTLVRVGSAIFGVRE